MKKKIILSLLAAVFSLTGCVVNIRTQGGNDGGVYRTQDNGDNWQQITMVYRVEDSQKTFSNMDLTAMIMDPTDKQALYLGTKSDGMFYTYNGGTGWSQTLTGLGEINAIAVSPKERCIIFTAIQNKIYKSVDCSRHWNYQLVETREDPKNNITSLAIDNFNTRNIYAGTSGNGLFLSQDAGFSWQALKFFDYPIIKILINPKNSKIIYIATAQKGIFKTTDGGANWKQILNQDFIEQKQYVLDYRDLILDPTIEDGLLYASQYGLLRSGDGGDTWDDLKLLTPPGTTAIYSIAINPQNGQEIYYGIKDALYRSVDGGRNWITRNLPSSRAAAFLIFDPVNTSTLFLGVKKVN